MERFVRNLRVDEKGVTLVEYGLIVSLMCSIFILGLGTFGDQVVDIYNTVAEATRAS
ncbi:Flp family type IVb pilin [Sphingomonas sp. ID0503]|uniref:Flp family type IVb pilin n=1 Tax=Sphingomonas sp. ID0503 TaxID=3399691 RepID=UPI003AFB7A51